jgi:hypothetical protein
MVFFGVFEDETVARFEQIGEALEEMMNVQRCSALSSVETGPH